MRKAIYVRCPKCGWSIKETKLKQHQEKGCRLIGSKVKEA